MAMAAATAKDTIMTVLIVDDEPDILESLKVVLENSIPNVECKTALSAADGMVVLLKGGIDLILCDYRMPGTNGLEFLQQARAKDPDIPRILMTAFPRLELAIEAINDARVETFLTKPMNPDKLVKVVADMLAARRERMKAAA
jgi:two-component system, NtrC family, response regulator HydG